MFAGFCGQGCEMSWGEVSTFYRYVPHYADMRCDGYNLPFSRLTFVIPTPATNTLCFPIVEATKKLKSQRFFSVIGAKCMLILALRALLSNMPHEIPHITPTSSTHPYRPFAHDVTKQTSQSFAPSPLELNLRHCSFRSEIDALVHMQGRHLPNK